MQSLSREDEQKKREVSFIKSLTFKVLAVVMLSQLLILAIGGYIYVTNLSDSMDATVANRLKTVGALLQDSQLKYTALSDRGVMVELVGKELLDSMVVGVNGTIFHSLDKSRLGQSVSRFEDIELNWFNPTNVEPRILSLEKGDETSIVSITPIFTLNSTRPFLFGYIKLDSTRLTLQKRELVTSVMGAIGACILITSSLIFLFMRWSVFARISRAAGFTAAVAEGNLGLTLRSPVNDELGILERGLNRMVEDLRSRKGQSDEANIKLIEANETLELRVEERTKELSSTLDDLKLEAESHKQTSLALKRQGAFLNLLQRITVACNEASSMEEAWKVALKTISSHFQWPFGMVFVLDRDQHDVMRLSESVYMEEGNGTKYQHLMQASQNKEFGFGSGLVGNVLRSARPQLLKVDDISSKQDERMMIAQEAGLKWSFAIPVLVGREVVAVLEFFTVNELSQDSELFEVARDIGIQLGRVVERRQIADYMHKAKVASDVASHAKTEFISKLGHELRTPINAIVGFGQLLQSQTKDKKYTASQRDEHLNVITRAARHMVRLVDQMTDLAKIEAGEMKVDVTKVSIASTVESCVALIQPLLDDKKVEVIVSLGKCANAIVDAEQESLDQIILGLLRNAIHFAGSDKKILISAECEVGEVNLFISDQGTPLSRFEQEDIFQPLMRLDRHRGIVDGLGIGLTLGRELANVMGGDLNVLSGDKAVEVDGMQGNSFVLRLPAAP